MDDNLAIIFKERPSKWGLRGDPFLWDVFEKYFSDFPLPYSIEDFRKGFNSKFEIIVGVKLTSEELIQIPRLSHGGMSSGMVSPKFWLETALPLLINRLHNINHL